MADSQKAQDIAGAVEKFARDPRLVMVPGLGATLRSLAEFVIETDRRLVILEAMADPAGVNRIAAMMKRGQLG